eukprot:CAMPEP_0181387282 /NCGR_PEP_ID=MMETSP1106-20121128/23629_1 /TAXON_ID=81844 /ORGANISM="Mantoniella antarctica, Strain SL-175" /LENGTH=198 /DNA_ID=CAMNT_0023507637 /DNA_START=149 /DNA_END=741 /DNA_ORIENTATION=-
MYDASGTPAKVRQPREHLRQDGPRLPFHHGALRLETRVQVVPRAQLQHRAEAVLVHLEHVDQAHHRRVPHLLVDAALARGVAHVRALALLAPLRAQLVQLARHLAHVHRVVRLVHVAEAPAAQHVHQHIPSAQQRVLVEPAALLVAGTLQLADVRSLFAVQQLTFAANGVLLALDSCHAHLVHLLGQHELCLKQRRVL